MARDDRALVLLAALAIATVLVVAGAL